MRTVKAYRFTSGIRLGNWGWVGGIPPLSVGVLLDGRYWLFWVQLWLKTVFVLFKVPLRRYYKATVYL